jgi:hypothetical protein
MRLLLGQFSIDIFEDKDELLGDSLTIAVSRRQDGEVIPPKNGWIKGINSLHFPRDPEYKMPKSEEDSKS